jgi:acylphosphatase
MADVASLQAMVRGRVQGVFFRAFAERSAQELKLKGYVRNLSDGTMEVRAEGERDKLEKLVECLKNGPPAAKVQGIAVTWKEYKGEFTGFSIRY